MNKTLLMAGMAVAMAVNMQAETKVYSPDILGELNGVSANGKYAVAADFDNHRAYLWNIDNPTEWKDITPIDPEGETLPADRREGAEVYAVTDNGMVVGCVYYGDHTAHPAYWRDGVWYDLPMHAASMNTNAVVATTATGDVLGGYMFISDPAGNIPGHYYPCQWVVSETDPDDYTLTAYTDIVLPDHMGFFPSCQSPDGSILAGMVFCGIQSTVPAMVKNGELTIFAELETKFEPFIWKGKYETRDEDGKQGWTDDPNDPNIVLYPEPYIDGVKDTNEHPFVGRFSRCDWSGNLYGCRTVATDVTEEGEGKLTDGACIYNYDNGQWIDNSKYQAFSTGLEGRIIFAGGTRVIMDGTENTITSEFDFTSSRMIAAVNCTSEDGRILGAMTAQLNDATSEYDYFPMIIELDTPLVEVSGVSEVYIADGAPVIITSAGRIEVVGADSVAVYGINGQLVSTTAVSSVAPGIYVVKTEKGSYKICVK